MSCDAMNDTHDMLFSHVPQMSASLSPTTHKPHNPYTHGSMTARSSASELRRAARAQVEQTPHHAWTHDGPVSPTYGTSGPVSPRRQPPMPLPPMPNNLM